VGTGALVAIGAARFFLVSTNEYQLTVGATVGIDAISTIGLTVVVGRAGQLALGQAGFMAVGGYAVAYGTTHSHLSFLVALIVGMAIALALGALVGWIALRLTGNYLAMATLAFGAIIYGLLEVQGRFGGAGGLFGIPPIELFGMRVVSPQASYVFIWVVVLLAFAAAALYLRGRAGRELEALRDDQLAASALGVNTTYRKVQAFALSAVLGALAGGIMAANQTVIDPSLFAPLISFQIFLMAVIGGLGSLSGAVAGAAIVVWLVQLTPGTGDSAYVVLGVVVVVLMALFPRGLAGMVSALVGRLRPRRAAPPSPGAPDEQLETVGGP
jgi:branched-chain amino acid transport system permease protein